jgi:SulP family sulfate permease
MQRYFPFLTWVKELDAGTIRADLLAGITGAIIVLPQGVAFAIIAGMPPIYGLYTAMVLPIVAALFGSSRHLISGPTTAISIVIFSTVSQYADPATPEFVTIAIGVTLITGVIQLILGLARLGVLVNFVSHSVIIGFTAGAAILIATSQIKHFFGLKIEQGLSFAETWYEVIISISQAEPYVLIVSISTLIIALLIKRIHRLAPHMLVAMIVGSIISIFLGGESAGINAVGELPQGLPPFSWPILTYEMTQKIAPNAFAVALLGLIEAVAIARSISTKTGQRIDGNQEFIGQGLSNIVGSFFSCYAGSGSFTRSGVNYSAGARTPLAAIFAAIILMLVISFVAPLAAYLPIPAMAGIIVLVAYNLIDFDHIKKIVKTSKRESTVLFITLFATLVVELEYAIYLGVFFSLVFYLQQTSQPRFVRLSPDPDHKYRKFINAQKNEMEECPQLLVVRIEGSLFFGAVEHVLRKMDELFKEPQRHLLIVSNSINLIDTSGAEMLVELAHQWKKHNKSSYFSGLKLRARKFLKDGGFWDEIGDESFFDHKEEAVHHIYNRLDEGKCKVCSVRIFTECPESSVTKVTS